MTRARTILLVEDNVDDAELTLRAFRKHAIAHEVVVVRDGKEAVDHLLTLGASCPLPELVLLDLKLPRVDGIEVLKRLRADPRTRQLPIVVFSSSKEERDVVACYALGANSFVQKPVDFSQFVEAVRKVGLYWLVLNEAPPPRIGG